MSNHRSQLTTPRSLKSISVSLKISVGLHGGGGGGRISHLSEYDETPQNHQDFQSDRGVK